MEYKFDLHVHTNYSDGTSKPEDVVKYAKSIGLDGIAITDHDTVKGMEKAEKLAKKVGIILVPGLEITTPFGDIVALGIREVINGFDAKLPEVVEIINKIHKKGGIAILAHPYGGYWKKSFVETKLVSRFDAIEIFNSLTNNNFGIESNVKAIELAKKVKLPGIGGSDAHFLEMIGSAFTISKTKDIISAIRKADVKVGWL